MKVALQIAVSAFTLALVTGCAELRHLAPRIKPMVEAVVPDTVPYTEVTLLRYEW